MKEKIILFCLPFAGGNKYSYREYIEKAPSFLKIVPLEYPGRGTRAKELLLTDINDLIEDLYRQINTKVDSYTYAIYGHSMGGLLAYLLTLKLLKNGHRSPIHLFITGTSGPSAPNRSERKRHLLDRKEFIDEIRKLDGMPEEILENEELLYYFEPILRSDFKVIENYIYEDNPPLNTPITVITGSEEDINKEDIEMWQLITTCKVDFRQMQGKHFFIFNNSLEIIELISQQLNVHIKAFYL